MTEPGSTVHEAAFAALVGTRHAVAFAYARTALTLVLGELVPSAGRSVVISALNCRVVPLAVTRAGCRPIYSDIDPASLNLDPARLDSCLRPDTAAVLFQHTYGQGTGLGRIRGLVESRGLPLIEDRAQVCPGSGAAPVQGIAAIYSNNLRKPLPAGSGGMLVTDDDDLAARIRAARDRLPLPGLVRSLFQGFQSLVHDRLLTPERYWSAYDLHTRLDARKSQDRASLEAREIVSAETRVTASQERRGDRWLRQAPAIAAARAQVVARYRGALSETGVELPASEALGSLYYFPVVVPDKPGLLERARRERVEIIAWPLGLPIYPVDSEAGLRDLGYQPGQCPIAERVAAGLVGLPTWFGPGRDQTDRVLQLIRSIAPATAGR